jgi:hypothetical protein
LVQIPFDFPVHMRPQPPFVTGGTNLADVGPSFAQHGRDGHAEVLIAFGRSGRDGRAHHRGGARATKQLVVFIQFYGTRRAPDG